MLYGEKLGKTCMLIAMFSFGINIREINHNKLLMVATNYWKFLLQYIVTLNYYINIRALILKSNFFYIKSISLMLKKHAYKNHKILNTSNKKHVSILH
jgi:hypothetical protein